MSHNELREEIEYVCGKKIKKIYRFFWAIEGIYLVWGEGPLQIEFADGMIVRFHVGSNGMTPRIEFTQWKDPFPLRLSEENLAFIEESGTYRQIDVSKAPIYRKIIGKKIIKYHELKHEDFLCGIQFVIEGDVYLNIHMLFDEEIVVWGKNPSEMIEKGIYIIN